MRKFKNAPETLDALEEAWPPSTVPGTPEHLPDSFVVALYRLAEVQLSELELVRSIDWRDRSRGELERERSRFESHASLGSWIAEQPE